MAALSRVQDGHAEGMRQFKERRGALRCMFLQKVR